MYYTIFNNDTEINFTLEEWDILPFHNIKNIAFCDKQLTELPNLDKLINLEVLICCFNQLTELPNLDKLINLTDLYCKNNRLTELPNLDKLKNLKYLNCKNNQLTSLPFSIRKCKKLYIYNGEYDIPDYQYIEELPYLVNKEIEKYYNKPILDYYNYKHL